jgi:hypothetical protein
MAKWNFASPISKNVTCNMRHEIRQPAKKAPMTAAERQRKHRARISKAIASLTLEQTFRRELAQFVRTFTLFHPKIKVACLADSLEKCGTALVMDIWRRKNNKQRDELSEDRFLSAAVGETWDSLYGLWGAGDGAPAWADIADLDFSDPEEPQ